MTDESRKTFTRPPSLYRGPIEFNVKVPIVYFMGFYFNGLDSVADWLGDLLGVAHIKVTSAEWVAEGDVEYVKVGGYMTPVNG